jgi:hypothetical protein
MFNEDHLNYAEKIMSMVQPDSLVPYQYLETTKRKVHLEAEKILMLAVLEDAIYCFQKYFNARGRKEQLLFHDTQAWIVAPGSSWIFSFQNICETLGLDPSYIRRGLLHWEQTMLIQTQPEPIPRLRRKKASHKKRLRFAA